MAAHTCDSPASCLSWWPRPSSHARTSSAENNGFAADPPTGCGKSGNRLRQLLTAARDTPAMSAMSLGDSSPCAAFMPHH